MKKLTITTASLVEKGHFTGGTILRDFSKYGHVTVSFVVNDTVLTPVDINGFSIDGQRYVKEPLNNVDEAKNKRFKERFFNDLEPFNKSVLLDTFGNIL